MNCSWVVRLKRSAWNVHFGGVGAVIFGSAQHRLAAVWFEFAAGGDGAWAGVHAVAGITDQASDVAGALRLKPCQCAVI